MAIDAKICGIKTQDALDAAIQGGAAYVGFVFYKPSPRHLSPHSAKQLRKQLPSSIQAVALTVDATNEDLQAIVQEINPDLLQLHGKEAPDRANEVRTRFGLPVLKAIPISSENDLEMAKFYQSSADMLLFDAKPPNDLASALPGGNALSFDWTLLAGKNWEIPWMLSGGLTPQNVGEAIEISGAQAVDVSSGVESARGQKDPHLIKDFLDRVAQV